MKWKRKHGVFSMKSYVVRVVRSTVDSEISRDLYFANFSFPNNSRFLEFVCEHSID